MWLRCICLDRPLIAYFSVWKCVDSRFIAENMFFLCISIANKTVLKCYFRRYTMWKIFPVGVRGSNSCFGCPETRLWSDGLPTETSGGCLQCQSARPLWATLWSATDICGLWLGYATKCAILALVYSPGFVHLQMHMLCYCRWSARHTRWRIQGQCGSLSKAGNKQRSWTGGSNSEWWRVANTYWAFWVKSRSLHHFDSTSFELSRISICPVKKGWCLTLPSRVWDCKIAFIRTVSGWLKFRLEFIWKFWMHIFST